MSEETAEQYLNRVLQTGNVELYPEGTFVHPGSVTGTTTHFTVSVDIDAGTSFELIDDTDPGYIPPVIPKPEVHAEVKHTRFKDAPWFPKEPITVLVGGAGGIGSWLVLMLSRAGFKPIVYDFDRLEELNMAGQLYPRKSIGEFKVRALEEMCKSFNDEIIIGMDEKITAESPTHHYAISAFDNMKARREMFESWFNLMKENPELRSSGLFMDARLEAEIMTIYCVTATSSKTCERYRAELFDDSEIPDVSCTMKQTSHAAAMVASHMAGFFTNHITNVVEKDNTRTVPFKWEYFIPMDLITVDY